MMRLPLPSLGITHACNFAATATLCNLISGVSVSLYMPAQPTKTNKKWIGSGEAFRSLATAFYPWPPGQNPKDGAAMLYDLFRNPFAHALGVHGLTAHTVTVARLRSGAGLEESELQEIESSAVRPSWLPPGLSSSRQTWKLVVEAFYRDVFHMLWNLGKDAAQMTAAEKRFAGGTLVWRN